MARPVFHCSSYSREFFEKLSSRRIGVGPDCKGLADHGHICDPDDPTSIAHYRINCGHGCQAPTCSVITHWRLPGFTVAFIDSIYGDMIKTDPYAPQEIKLALTGDITGDFREYIR